MVSTNRGQRVGSAPMWSGCRASRLGANGPLKVPNHARQPRAAEHIETSKERRKDRSDYSSRYETRIRSLNQYHLCSGQQQQQLNPCFHSVVNSCSCPWNKQNPHRELRARGPLGAPPCGPGLHQDPHPPKTSSITTSSACDPEAERRCDRWQRSDPRAGL